MQDFLIIVLPVFYFIVFLLIIKDIKIKVIPFLILTLGLSAIGMFIGLDIVSKGYLKGEEFAFFYVAYLYFSSWISVLLFVEDDVKDRPTRF